MLNGQFSTIKLPKMVLASGSPRRAEILTSVGWEFTKIVPDIDESVLGGESPEDYVQRLAREKALATAPGHGLECVLAADTTVVVDEHILGKPENEDDARRMLKMLSGRWHDVLTGVAVIYRNEVEVGMQRTGVKFSPMSEDEIEYLVKYGNQ